MSAGDYRRAFEDELARAQGSPPIPLQASLELASGPGLESAAPGEVPLDPAELAALIERAGNPAAPAEVRIAALQELQIAAFLGDRFAPFRAAYVALLRVLLNSEVQRLRDLAYETLAQMHDDEVQARLVAGLDDPSQATLSSARALALLAYDDHGPGVGAARRLLLQGEDSATREQAARVLSADPSSKDTLAQVAANADEGLPVRAAAAISLYALDRGLFEQTASQIERDDPLSVTLEAAPRGLLRR